uniref:hypothetical protein n=1 Tax=Paractinoplanes polyasparticus TaxID=2856853 RepID=UPI001C846B6B|nr:hypothetical protein [Actinoplanes polyasparticus]
MEATVGELNLTARVVGAERSPRAEVAGVLTGEPARDRMLAALAPSFGGAEVIVVRAVSCRTVIGLGRPGAADVLPRAIASAVATMLRDHPFDDDWVVRFRDRPAYVAAFLRDALAGHDNRWYYEPFRRYCRPDWTIDTATLLADHHADRWRVLAALPGPAGLDAVLARLGDDLPALIGDAARPVADRWLPLVRTAAAIVSVPLEPPERERLAAVLAAAEPPPDWRDRRSLGHAVGAAVRALLRDTDPVPVVQDHDWFDHDAFTAAVHGRAVPTAGPPTAATPRVQRLRADLTTAAADPALRLNSAGPDVAADVARVMATLVRHAPRWAGDELAVDYVAHLLRQPAKTTDSLVRSLRRTATTAPTALDEPVPSATAAGLLVLRGLLGLGLTTSLLAPVGGEPLLSAVLRRWTGSGRGDDPLLDLIAETAGTGRQPFETPELPYAPPCRHVTVPHQADGFATVTVDRTGRVLPFAVPGAAAADDPDLTAAVANALAALGGPATSDPDGLGVDLLAVTALQAWARWLPGFAAASVPFLLATMVRRPAAVRITGGNVDVRLPARPHDIVLRLAGYLDPLDTYTVLGGRTIRFVVEDDG